MGSTYYSLHHHFVFSTKDRRPLLRPEWRPRAHEYLGGTVRGLGGVAESVGGVEDHVHLLVSLRTTHALGDFVRELKKASSVWISDEFDQQFAWQEGFGAFSVSWTHLNAVKGYIARQEAHHAKVSFGDEFRKLLERNGVQFDPKYLV